MGRANNLCEGCGRRRAAQVHHLTYDHVFDEFLWELIAICDECHSRVHDRDVNPPSPTDPVTLRPVSR
jgi:hypothetical protein